MRCVDDAIFQTSLIVPNFFRRLPCALFLPGTFCGTNLPLLYGWKLFLRTRHCVVNSRILNGIVDRRCFLVRHHIQCQVFFWKNEFLGSKAQAKQMPRTTSRLISDENRWLSISANSSPAPTITSPKFNKLFFILFDINTGIIRLTSKKLFCSR
jgi:hypothetical protein